jgi:hypothetical protein
MRKKTRSLIVGMALFAVAGMVVAQNADQNTGGPTRNTLQLKLIEPAEGASITGDSVRVSVDYNHKLFGAGQGTHFGDPNFPQARFDVYLDNSLKSSLKGESNTVTIDRVPSGTHKIAVVALNVSGEVIDRKEVNVTTSPTVVAESRTETTVATAPAPEPRPPAPAPSTYQAAPAPPAPMETTLPHTASAFPRLALLGLALVASGLLVGRKGR